MSKFTLDNLMRVCGEGEAEARGITKKFYLRTIGQTAEDARRDYATNKSRAMYRALKNVESADYARYMAELYEMDDEGLRAALLSMKLPVIRREAFLEIRPVDPPETPDHPTISEVLESEEAEEVIERDVEKERADFVERTMNAYHETIQARDHAALLDEAVNLRFDAVVASVYGRAFADATLYWSAFSDPRRRVRFFANEDEVGEADPALRDSLMALYNDMDVFTREPDALKN